MPTIFDLVKAEEIASYYQETNSNRIPYLGETLFPPDKKQGLDLSWIKGAGGLPVSLMPSAFDAKATIRDRIGLDRVETEMPFFREGMNIGEKERQELFKLLDTNNSNYYQPLITRIYDDRATLVSGAQVVPERMRMQLLSTGTISIVANRQNYTYDYKFNPNHKETLLGDDRWSQPDSTPVQDIQRWLDLIEDETGTRPTSAIMTRKTFNYLMVNASIRLDMNPIGGTNIILTDSMLRQYIQAKLGVNIAVYNKQYKDESGASRLFFPDDVVTFIPEGNLGTTWYGTTPEEADLQSGATDAQVSIVETGVAITTIKEPHPVNVNTIVSEIVLPSFENMDNIFIATVN
ncbi:major capsid protein [Paenibacillus polysaccharolyticus]|uniref:major capsid protein n=1 Tax=Paenibacillus polysaccharolyticus TaxID=582692 RepID=UPI00203DC888|nr:major capsid protein [Paenibacillus polysaccharolyticus]MCM3131894.1 major capsid protein [Paenibacillus polysaccharolyticus]